MAYVLSRCRLLLAAMRYGGDVMVQVSVQAGRH